MPDKNRIYQKEKTMAKIIMVVMILGLALLACDSLKAEDYPVSYMGPGYRNYLTEKIQNGYFVEIFANLDMRQLERVDKRNEIEKILGYSYEAGPQTTNNILATDYQTAYNSATLKIEIGQQRQQRQQIASAELAEGFNYLPHSDGRIDYFKDGLLIASVNERVVDQLGNVSLKNTYNIQYNDNRLMISYDATIKDNLGNVTQQSWYGATYSADSIFYGGKDTNANKNLTEYYLKETDSAGNVRLSHWQALSYDGKCVRAFHQRIEDSVYGISDFTRSNITYCNNDPDYASSYHEEGIGTDGLSYSADRSNIKYNGSGQLTAYHEVVLLTQPDGTVSKITVDATFKYADVPNQFGPDVESDPSRMLESIITSTTEGADGSIRNETTTTTYGYDSGLRLISASGVSQLSGQEADWYEYSDAQGHILTKGTDADGNTIYFYTDPETSEEFYVSADQVKTTVKEGNKYQGTTYTAYELVYGAPMAKETHSRLYFYGENISAGELLRIEDSSVTYTNGLVNNLRRALSIQEHNETTYPLTDPQNTHKTIRDSSSTYVYAVNGNLVDFLSSGASEGWEYSPTRGWYNQYTSTFREDYDIILGKPARTNYYEDKNYLHQD
jgi:hypothetical protein